MKRAPDQRTVTIGDKSYGALWAQFVAQASVDESRVETEEGWRSTTEIATEMGINRSTAEHHLKAAVSAGRMERITARVRGGRQRANYWRPKA